MKTTWGFAALLSLKTFKDHSNGYLVNDSCVFGAEVFVINSTGNWETLSFVKGQDLHNNATFTWKIDKFSNITKLDKNCSKLSEVFSFGRNDW